MSAFAAPFFFSSVSQLIEVNSNLGAYNLFVAAGSPLYPATIHFNAFSSTRIKVLDMRGFAPNSRVFMILDGYIYAPGGNGGTGEIIEVTPPGLNIPAGDGFPAGHAILLDSSVELWITVNASGKVYGGGGGEGGRNWLGVGSGTGPGGGGGVEAGLGGSGNPSGADSTGVGVAAIPGGGGGTWATAGTTHASAGAGGAAGKAISLNGGVVHLTNLGDVRGAIS